MDKKTMRYEIAKDVFPQAIENSMMVVRNSNLTMMKYAAYLAVSYADALIKELNKGGKQ